MLDFGFFHPTPNVDVQVFTSPATVTNLQWQTWRRPRGVVMASILVLGGGGGGGGGFSAASGSARGGGGGGGSSSQTVITVPVFLLPDILYVQVGAGGAGGGAGVAGSNGIASFVSVYPNTSGNNIVAVSSHPGGNFASGGTAGTGAAAGTGGIAASVATMSVMNLAGLGVAFAFAGQGGANGGAQTGAVGVSITLPTTGLVITGGAGGAGTTSADFAGGAFVATANTLVSEDRPIAPAAGSNNGSGGFSLKKPFFCYGGCGGSASDAGVGGNGGPGAYGCGGGGGGGGTTGGSGGNGGNGIVVIMCW